MSDRCRAGKGCLNRTADGPAITHHPLCDGCVTDIQRCIDQLPGYLDMLALFKGYKPAAVGGARVSGKSTEGAVPLNLVVVDLINAIAAVLTRVGGYAVRDLVTLAGGVEDALEARKVHSQAAGICGLERVWQRRRALCPECELPTLGGWLGEDRIQCTNAECGATLSKVEYIEHCEAQVNMKVKRRG